MGALRAFLRQRFIVELARGDRVEAEVELIFLSETVLALNQNSVSGSVWAKSKFELTHYPALSQFFRLIKSP